MRKSGYYSKPSSFGIRDLLKAYMRYNIVSSTLLENKGLQIKIVIVLSSLFRKYKKEDKIWKFYMQLGLNFQILFYFCPYSFQPNGDKREGKIKKKKNRVSQGSNLPWSGSLNLNFVLFTKLRRRLKVKRKQP